MLNHNLNNVCSREGSDRALYLAKWSDRASETKRFRAGLITGSWFLKHQQPDIGGDLRNHLDEWMVSGVKWLCISDVQSNFFSTLNISICEDFCCEVSNGFEITESQFLLNCLVNVPMFNQP